MKKIIHNEEFGIPYTNLVNRMTVNALKALLGVNKINVLYDKLHEYDGVQFANKALELLDIEILTSDKSRKNIPSKGGFIAIANQPHGTIDTMIMIDLIAQKRPDIKFMGNFIFEKIDPLKNVIIPLNQFNSNSSRNTPSFRQALEHLEEGKGLIIFPAGDVSTFRNGLSNIEDSEWEKPIIKFIRKAKVPIIPIYISGRNSLKFHILSKIHPTLGKLRLPRELLNKRGYAVEVVIGSPMTAQLQKECNTIEELGDYLRANIYYMKNAFEDELFNPNDDTDKVKPILKHNPEDTILTKAIAREIEEIPSSNKILELDYYTAYITTTNSSPQITNEIFKLRHGILYQTDKETLLQSFNDTFDDYYHHLFIWDNKNNKIAAACRLGYGKEIVPEYGIDGFYTFSNFEYSPKLTPILTQSIEMSNPFISLTHKNKNKPILMIWQATLAIAHRDSSCQYILGAANVSSSNSDVAKSIMINFIKEWHWHPRLNKLIIPRNGVKSLEKQNTSTYLLRGVDSFNLIDKLVVDLESDKSQRPILLKKYLQVGGTVLAFNKNIEQNDSIEALVMINIMNLHEGNRGMASIK